MMGRLIAVAALCITLTGCGSDLGSQNSVPHAESIDSSFLKRMSKIDNSDPVNFIVSLEAIDRDPQIPLARGEFETASAFQERQQHYLLPPHYPTGYYGLIKTLAFSYDPEHQMANINTDDSSAYQKPIYTFSQLTISQDCGQLPNILKVAIPLEIAQRIKSDDSLRLGVIFSVSGEAAPILSGTQNLTQIANDSIKETGEQLSNHGDLDQTSPAHVALNSASVTVKAHVSKVLVYDKTASALRPFYSWTAKSLDCRPRQG